MAIEASDYAMGILIVIGGLGGFGPKSCRIAHPVTPQKAQTGGYALGLVPKRGGHQSTRRKRQLRR